VADLIDILVCTIPRKINIKLQPSEATGNVNVDVTQLQQALLNVCINAGDAMPDGGTLGIATRVFTTDEAFLETHPEFDPGTWCAIDISDTGGGIADDQRNKIFEPFFTTKERGRGTGLGLSITLGIIHNHGGHIVVHNAISGAVFTIYLPAVEPAPYSRDAQPSEDECGNNETVLLVDDEIEFLETTTEMLEAYGYRPLPVSRGDEAVDIFNKHHRTIDIVVLDMIMKDMDGAEVFRELKRIQPEVKVILCSGYSIDGQAGQLLDEGIAAFVQKPFNIRRLTAKIRSVLEQ
jgi:CheY-like chemotaxis protein